MLDRGEHFLPYSHRGPGPGATIADALGLGPKEDLQMPSPKSLTAGLEQRVEASSNADLLEALGTVLIEARERGWNYVEAANESLGAAEDGFLFVSKLRRLLADALFGEKTVGEGIDCHMRELNRRL